MATFNVDHIVSKVAEKGLIIRLGGIEFMAYCHSHRHLQREKVTLTFEFKNTEKQEKASIGQAEICSAVSTPIQQHMKAVIVSNKGAHSIESGSIEHEQCLGNDLLASLTTTSSVIGKCTDCDSRLCSAIVLTLSSSH